MWKIAPVIILSACLATTASQEPQASVQPGFGAGMDGGPCCKECDQGQPCGATCIAASHTCHQPPGCACYVAELP